ncbi:adapter molecule Crk-like [Limulus polyphemus]|uniref:Adapter molecule Crk-like n=1 Tax=Limulus polyphemus TaxID=6850 RepID=A0ABM1BH46_LIMPO|nr:adapter molecule Crk-like [Limulus polyphemus]XP_022249857.1 adapter molecule Crk-like [Limulus polyphemus]
MAGSFDPYDKNSWFVGPMTRQEATDLLMAENEAGIFIVRNSATIQGDLVLCVREDNKVSHYIINKIQQGDQTRFRIGDQMFPDIPSLLNFYKLHYLDTTPLIQPAERKVEKVRAKYDFTGSGDADDLPFKKGEILTIISKDEEQWWTARNSFGQTGSIPVPYIEKYDENQIDGQNWQGSATTAQSGSSQLSSNTRNRYNTPNIQRKLPALARVKQARVPNAYDKTALKLEVGEVIKVTKMNINGQWEGELRGKTGHFPFTHVEFIDSENSEDDES